MTVFSHKNVSSPVQSRKTVWTLKTLSIWALSIFFMKKKNNPWQKFYCPQKAQLLARKKKLRLGQCCGRYKAMAREKIL